MDEKKETIERIVGQENGILRMEPAWVARDFLPPGKRLGLKESEYDVGERGYICERWLASVTLADNAVGPEDEGLSYIQSSAGDRVTLKEAVDQQPALLMGSEYAKTHEGLGRLAKIFDYQTRLPYHLHQMQHHAQLVGRNSKDEAYHFLDGVELGAHPETFLGVHPYITEEKMQDMLLPYLEDWDSDLILKHSRAYLNVAGEGFFIPSGVPHGPGTALTLELQEDSDVFAMLQALNAGQIISKELLFKDVRKEDREKYGERVILDQIDWDTSGDPYFYENHHLVPIPDEETRQPGAVEYWIYYNTPKFSGKKLILEPGKSFRSVDRGCYSVLVWRGSGEFDGRPVVAGDPRQDELFVTHDKAVESLEIKNTGSEDLVLVKFFGPDINTGVTPRIEPRGGTRLHGA
jgi:hypothetical protein